MVIFERSWRSGEVPDNWKKASVSPVFKMGKKEDPGYYWAVRLTSTSGKVMEHFVMEGTSTYIEENKKAIKSSQHGCTKGPA
ncbi:hypothetical protein BTVI_148907 [Pitangus sulphuratus]|nr:hypothetical protein BTVI_148907 [Pitangus sulphuratus]